MSFSLDARPILIAIVGPNGAGKSTFYDAHISYTGLPFINADTIASEAGLGAYEAADVAKSVRHEMFKRRESFVFETVFSDPVAEKLNFLEHAAATGYTVVLFFIGLGSTATSIDRVAMRTMQGGHAVPEDKLLTQFARTLENLRLALLRLPTVMVYDNEDLREPYRLVLVASDGTVVERPARTPTWLKPLLPAASAPPAKLGSR